MSEKQNLFRKSLILVVFFIIAFFCLFPFYILPVMGSYPSEVLMQTLPYTFGTYFLTNLQKLTASGFWNSYMNSVIVSALSIIGSCTISVLMAYSITKYRFRARKFLEELVILTMMLPTQVSIIGYVLEMRVVNLTNTIWPLIFIWLAHPLTTFLLIQFMKSSVPIEIIESGRIDGCSEVRILRSLVMPFVMPGLATTSTLIFLWSWNSYTLPMLIVNVKNSYTIPIFVSNLFSEFRIDLGAQLAALTMAVFPILILFSFFSKFFIKGIAAGSVKG